MGNVWIADRESTGERRETVVMGRRRKGNKEADNQAQVLISMERPQVQSPLHTRSDGIPPG
jgi:hypothetical protein